MKRLLICVLILSLLVTGVVLVSSQRGKPLSLFTPVTSPNALPDGRLSPPLVYGYLPYWTEKKAQFSPALTHVSYFSLAIHTDGHIDGIDGSKTTEAGARAIQNGVLEKLRTTIPSTTALELTLTMMDQKEIPVFVDTPGIADATASDLAWLFSHYPITGVNIDVEYVGETTPQQQQAFATYVRDVSKRLKDKHPVAHLSIAIMADSADRPRLTNPTLLAPSVDHIIVMAYDYHQRGSLKTGPNAPLYASEDSIFGRDILTSLRSIQASVPSNKIILGIPLYGYQWGVEGSDTSNFTLPKTGKTMTYAQIIALLQSKQVQRFFDPVSLTPYITFEQDGTTQQLFYEDAQSIRYKLELVTQAHLGGIALWALGFEGSSRDLWKTITEWTQSR